MHKLQQFSIEIAADIYNDLNREFKSALIVSKLDIRKYFSHKLTTEAQIVWKKDIAIDLEVGRSSTQDEDPGQFDFILIDLPYIGDIENALRASKSLLAKDGVLIVNVLGGHTLKELANALFEADLLENRVITRLPARIKPDGLMSISKAIFKHSLVIGNELQVNFSSVEEIINYLKSIEYPISTDGSSDYWELVAKIYTERHHSYIVSFEILTLLMIV